MYGTFRIIHNFGFLHRNAMGVGAYFTVMDAERSKGFVRIARWKRKG